VRYSYNITFERATFRLLRAHVNSLVALSAAWSSGDE
jgi:hypothetical protein